MGNLVRRPSAGTASANGRQAQRPDTGSDGDVDALDFGGKITTFVDLGLPDPQAQPGILAHGVETDSRIRRRRSDDTYFRRAIAWSATRNRLIIHRMEESVRRRGDGRFSVSGAWAKTGSVVRQAATPAAVRRGNVPHAPQTGEPTTACDDAPDRFAAAYDDLSMLPRPVRSSVLNRAAHPDHFYSLLMRRHKGGVTQYYSLQLLRSNAREGIVVVASRIEGASNWQVAQYTYDFTENVPADRSISSHSRGQLT